MTACLVAQPKPGTGGCPCGHYPDPCSLSHACLPQGTPPATTCFPSATACRAISATCTTCEWDDPWAAQVCSGAGASSSVLLVLFAGALLVGGLVIAHHHSGGGGAAPVRRGGFS